MSKTLQLKRANTSVNDSYTGSIGEITVDTSTWDLRVHDGVTAGGWVIDSSNGGGSFSNLTVSSNASIGNLTVTGTITGNLSGYATTSYVDTQVANLVASAPATLDTLNELATALGNDAAFSTTVTSSIANNASNVTTLQSQVANLNYYDNTNVASYLSSFDGNIIPSANATYTLGNSSNQWSEIWVSANTIYIGGVSLSLTDGNVLTINGNALLSNSSSTSITTDGNISAGNILTNSYFYANGVAVQFGDPTNISIIQGNITTIESQISELQSTSHANLESNVTTLEGNVATLEGNISSLESSIPSLGNFSLTNNTIETDSGVDGITLSISGADEADPPAFITRNWTFANTGSFTSGGNLNAPGAVLTGNLTSGNIYTGRIITSSSLHVNSYASIAAQMTAYSLLVNTTSTFNGTITATNMNANGNITVGNILTDNYFYANGNPFVSSNYGDSDVTSLLDSFGSNNISTTGNVTANNFIGNIEITGNVTGTSANVDIIADTYQWSFDNTGNLTLPGNIFAVNYANGVVVSFGGNYSDANVDAYLPTYSGNITAGNILTDNYFYANGDPFVSGGGSGISDLIQDTSPQLGGNLDINNNDITGTGNVNITGNITLSGNISAGNLIGTIATASQTGITEVGTLGSLSVTGNVTGGNLITAGSAEITGNATIGNITTTNITGTEANVTITANSYVTTFDITGLATFPGAVQLAVYANTTVRDASITSPTPGMMIYVTGTGMQVRGATQWNTITGSGT